MSNFNKNPSSGSRVVPRGHADGRTDMTKLLVAVVLFRLVAYFKSYRN